MRKCGLLLLETDNFFEALQFYQKKYTDTVSTCDIIVNKQMNESKHFNFWLFSYSSHADNYSSKNIFDNMKSLRWG